MWGMEITEKLMRMVGMMAVMMMIGKTTISFCCVVVD